MALYENGILISGANTLPQMTLAEYQALPVSERPTYWERTDLNYNNIPASQVSYKNGSVEDALDMIKAQMFGTAENVSYSAVTQSNFTLTGVSCRRCGDEIFFSCSVKVISNPSGWIKVATITLPNGTFQPIDVRESYKWTDVASQYALGAMVMQSAGNSDVYLYYRGGSTGDDIITMQIRIPIAVS